MPKEAINLKQIKKQNSTRLEKLLSNPKTIERLAKKQYGIERLAKKQYGKQWTKIWAGEHHPNNTQNKKWK
jgi:hypothetical protein